MNKTNIEDRDRRLIKKIRNIIEKKKPLEWQAPRRHPWSIFTLAGFIIVASIMFMIYHMIPERVLTDPSSTPEKVETDIQENPASMGQYTLTEIETRDISNEKQKPVQSLSSEPAPVLPPEEVAPHSKVVQTPKKAAPIETLPAIVSSTDVTISELVVCRSIKHRQYMSPDNRFSMGNGAKPVAWTWMNVLSDKPPQELSHIYYLNGKRYCRVILPAPYTRTRTWSKVRLNRPVHAGSWRVDVVNSSGQVIARANFTVVI